MGVIDIADCPAAETLPHFEPLHGRMVALDSPQYEDKSQWNLAGHSINYEDMATLKASKKLATLAV